MTDKLVDAEYALEEMMTELTSQPLPSEAELDEMMSEIRVLEQNEAMKEIEEDASKPASNQDELKAILSNIPSFTEMNKKS